MSYYTWALCEGPVSVISISLPNALQLVQRARKHGLKALFNRKEYTDAIKCGSHQFPINRPRINTGEFQLIQNEGIPLVDVGGGIPDRGVTNNVDATAYSEAHTEEPLELTQIHVRSDIEVISHQKHQASGGVAL